MNSVSVEIPLVWRFKDYPNYHVSRCKQIFNIKTGRKLKIVYNSGSLGVWIGKKFIPVSKINNAIEKIPNNICPF